MHYAVCTKAAKSPSLVEDFGRSMEEIAKDYGMNRRFVARHSGGSYAV